MLFFSFCYTCYVFSEMFYIFMFVYWEKKIEDNLSAHFFQVFQYTKKQEQIHQCTRSTGPDEVSGGLGKWGGLELQTRPQGKVVHL